GADVDVRADLRVADVREVRGLRAIAEGGLLRFHEIADLHLPPELRARAQMRVRPYHRVVFDHRVLGHGAGLEVHVLAGGDVDQMHARLDHAAWTDLRFPFQRDEWIDHRVAIDGDRGVDDRRVWIAKGDAALHQRADDALLNDRVDHGQLRARVHT